MSVSGITKQSLIASLGYLDPTQSDDVSSATSVDSLLSDSSNSSSDSSTQLSASTISQVGQLLSSLSKLHGKDPTAFKAAAANIASDFNTEASNLSDPLQRLTMESMAKQFSNAALTGSMSSLNMASVSNNLVRAYSSQNSMSLLDAFNTSQQDSQSSSSMYGVISSNLSSVLSSISG